MKTVQQKQQAREKGNAAGRRYYAKNGRKVRDRVNKAHHRRLAAKYGVSVDDAPANCECCGKFLNRDGPRPDLPCLDHCHLTDLFRGWLCSNCNIALGLVGDSPEGARKLLAYAEMAYARIQKRFRS